MGMLTFKEKVLFPALSIKLNGFELGFNINAKPSAIHTWFVLQVLQVDILRVRRKAGGPLQWTFLGYVFKNVADDLDSLRGTKKESEDDGSASYHHYLGRQKRFDYKMIGIVLSLVMFVCVGILASKLLPATIGLLMPIIVASPVVSMTWVQWLISWRTFVAWNQMQSGLYGLFYQLVHGAGDRDPSSGIVFALVHYRVWLWALIAVPAILMNAQVELFVLLSSGLISLWDAQEVKQAVLYFKWPLVLVKHLYLLGYNFAEGPGDRHWRPIALETSQPLGKGNRLAGLIAKYTCYANPLYQATLNEAEPLTNRGG